MPNYKDQKNCFIQNLIDAGCNQQMIEKCKLLKDNYKINELIDLLSHHKI